LGLGCAPLGGLFRSMTDAQSRAVVRRAREAGMRYFDTAPLYGHGTSEHRLGAALRVGGRRDFVVSTKVGRLVVPDPQGCSELFADAPPSRVVFDFSRDGILRSLDESLNRLGLDRVDIVYLHDPDDFADRAIAVAYPVLHALRDQGVVGAIGVGMNQPALPTRFVRETDIDVVLLAGRYTLLDRSGADELLPACLERGVSVVAGGVYNSGVLADPRPGVPYNYATAPPEVLARARRLEARCASYGVPLKAAAIQFPLRHPAVACVLASARNVDELEENLAMFGFEVPAPLWAELEETRVP
jgi:D-threo-aldose 1-dehydrogenase